MGVSAEKISNALLIGSFCGFALFVPFSISGVNISIGLGFVAVLAAFLWSPPARARFARAKSDPMLAACVLLVLSALPSVLMSENIQRALRDWRSYWILLVYFYAAYGLWSFAARRAVYWILLASTSLSCLVALAQYGIHYAVATLGTATTPIHARTLLRQTDKLYYCFDGDTAGRKAAWRADRSAALTPK